MYLVGVEYKVTTDGLQAADIPCLPKLLEAIGKVLAEKKTALSANELRFLRKRLRLASKSFAEYIGLSNEQYSRIENGAATVTPTVERVIRLLYATLASFSATEAQEVARTIWTAALHEERIVACRDKQDGWLVLTRAAA